MKKFSSIILTLIIALSLCACFPNEYADINDTPNKNRPAPQTKEELYSLYDAVERGMTKSEIEDMFGKGTPSYLDGSDEIQHYNYFNETESAGVSIVYDYDDTVMSKILFFNTKKNLVPFSERFDLKKVSQIDSGMTLAEAVKIMESTPLELSCTYGKNGPLDFQKIYCWYNEDAVNFMLHTDKDVIENVALYR